MISLKRILIPTDFSETSDSALRYARAFAEQFGASLHMLHVLDDPFVFAPTSEGYMPPPHYFDEMERAARTKMEQMLPKTDQTKLSARFEIKRGNPFVEIVRYAKQESVDLIVIGTHGRGPIAHMLMGSVAEKVVRKAPCPVLTVRQPEHEFVMP